MWKVIVLLLSCIHAKNTTNEVDLWIADPDGPEHIRFTWNLTSNVFQQKSIPLETNDYFEVSRHYMCSYMLKNVIYLIGGADESANKTEWDLFRRRNFKLQNHKIEQLPNLPFHMTSGQCVNYSGDSAIACNGGDDDEGLSRECYVTSNGVKYSPVGNLLGDHFRGSLTGYNSSALMIGGINSTQGTIEFLHKNKWTIVASDKRLSNLWDATPITLNGSIYLFGGFKCEKYTKEDPCTTNPSYNWGVLMIDAKTLKIKLHPQKLQTERWFARSILAGKLHHIVSVHFNLAFQTIKSYTSAATAMTTISRLSVGNRETTATLQ